MPVYIRTNDPRNPIYSTKDPEDYTVKELLDYIEKIATHTPDSSECDCHICNVHGSVCFFASMIGK